MMDNNKLSDPVDNTGHRDKDQGIKGGQSGETQAALLVQLAHDNGAELFHHDEEAFISFPTDQGRKTGLLQGKEARTWLRRLFYLSQGGVPGNQAVQGALDQLEAQAIFEGPARPVFIRVAEHEGAIYIDLANDAGEAVKIIPNNWDVVTDPPVRFRRKKGMLALPRPVAGGSIQMLYPLLNFSSEADFILFSACQVSTYRPRGPYPVLGLNAEQGGAKTTTTRLYRNFIDPNKASLRSLPGSLQDLIIAANNSWILALDNISHLARPMSDALCRVTTGAGFSTRQLYTSDEETIISVCRPVILNGIGEIATAPDLLDRSVLLTLPAIPPERRRSEQALWAEFEAVRPPVLGALFTAVATGMKNLPHTVSPELPRMADFALWGIACEEGLGWKPGSFMAAYSKNQKEATLIALEANPVGHLVLDLVHDYGDQEAPATQLLERLTIKAGEEVRRRREWPKTSHQLSNMLRRIAPALRAEGVDVEIGKSHQGRYIRLTLIDPAG